MSRRSAPRSKTDDTAFPIRVKFVVPGKGLGNLVLEMHEWLSQAIPQTDFARHGAKNFQHDAIAYYFRDIDVAHAFVKQFPQLELADHTEARSYHVATPAAGNPLEDWLVCNLYAVTSGQTAITELVGAMSDRTGNLPPLPGIYPDTLAPVVRMTPEGHELTMMRWGMPSPQFALKGRSVDRGVTNVRNTKSPHWRRWLGVENRCLVPFTAFSEYGGGPGEKKVPVWFELTGDQPIGFFAGIWTRWTSVRKLKDGETTDDLFGFLTTEANEVVAQVHPKAMPVILTEPEQWELWLTGKNDAALELQRPLPVLGLRLMKENPVELSARI